MNVELESGVYSCDDYYWGDSAVVGCSVDGCDVRSTDGLLVARIPVRTPMREDAFFWVAEIEAVDVDSCTAVGLSERASELTRTFATSLVHPNYSITVPFIKADVTCDLHDVVRLNHGEIESVTQRIIVKADHTLEWGWPWQCTCSDRSVSPLVPIPDDAFYDFGSRGPLLTWWTSAHPDPGEAPFAVVASTHEAREMYE